MTPSLCECNNNNFNQNYNLESICYTCNKLLCSICKQYHENHVIENKDDINYNSNNHINNRINTIWCTIRELIASKYNPLQTRHDEISSHFKELHEYLIIEEYRLKKSITKDLDTIKEDISQYIEELKSLIGIVSPTNNNNDRMEDYISDNSVTTDITESYLIDPIIKSINKSDTLDVFIRENSNTLFYQDSAAKNNQDIQNNYILESLYRYNQKYNLVSTINNNIDINNYNDYKLIIGNSSVNDIKKMIRKSIRLIQLNNRKKIYILSGGSGSSLNSRLSLIDITNHINSFEMITCKDSLAITYSSMVTVGEFVYIFGGGNTLSTQGRYRRFSVKSKSFDVVESMLGIEPGCSISVCYDGGNHIYLINGYNTQIESYYFRIDRFNIDTHTFERYYQQPTQQMNSRYSYDSPHILSFIWNGLLYSMPMNESLLIFDISNKKFIDAATINIDIDNNKINNLEMLSYTKIACTDNLGNIYFINQKMKFIKFNVRTYQIDHLQQPNINQFDPPLSMNYCKVSDEESNIYILGGKKHKNHIYSIEADQWETMLENDIINRNTCGSSVIYI